MQISLDHLRTYYYVCKYHEQSKAAQHLGLSKSGVSGQITTLEKMLSTKLMTRGKKKGKLTPSGKKLLHLIEKIIPEVEIIPSLIKSSNSIKGRIVLSTWPGIASHAISRNIRMFLEKYPGINIVINSKSSGDIFDNFDTDIGIFPFIEGRPDLKQVKIFDVKFGLYASKEYLKKFGPPQTMKELDKHKLISSHVSNDGLIKDANWHIYMESNFHRVPVYTVDSSVAILEAIKSGVGIGSLPTYYKPEEYGLIRLLKNINPKPINFYYIYPDYLESVKSVKGLEKFLLEKLPDLMKCD